MTDNNTVTGSPLVKRGWPTCSRGGVIMDVVTPNRLRLLKMLALLPVMALERVPADIRAQGGVAHI